MIVLAVLLVAFVSLWWAGFITFVREDEASFLVILLGPLGIVFRWQRGE